MNEWNVYTRLSDCFNGIAKTFELTFCKSTIGFGIGIRNGKVRCDALQPQVLCSHNLSRQFYSFRRPAAYPAHAGVHFKMYRDGFLLHIGYAVKLIDKFFVDHERFQFIVNNGVYFFQNRQTERNDGSDNACLSKFYTFLHGSDGKIRNPCSNSCNRRSYGTVSVGIRFDR